MKNRGANMEAEKNERQNKKNRAGRRGKRMKMEIDHNVKIKNKSL